MRRTVLVIHPGGLGDVLLAVPAIRQLRAKYAQRQLVFCAKSAVAQLLFECGVIDAWMSMEGMASADLFTSGTPPKGELKGWLSRCDCAIAWMQDGDGSLPAALGKAGAQRTIVASPFSADLQATHQSDRFREIVEGLPIPAAEFEPVQPPGKMRSLGLVCLEEAGLDANQLFVVVHPGSGSLLKSVAVTPMAATITKLQGEGVSAVVIEGPADTVSVSNLLQGLPSHVPVLRTLNLSTLAGVLSRASLFIGHDSGVTHLAAMLGVRTIAMFGPTDPRRWAPLGRHVTVIEAHSPSADQITSLLELPATQGSTIRPNHQRDRIESNGPCEPRDFSPRCLVSSYPVC